MLIASLPNIHPIPSTTKIVPKKTNSTNTCNTLKKAVDHVSSSRSLSFKPPLHTNTLETKKKQPLKKPLLTQSIQRPIKGQEKNNISKTTLSKKSPTLSPNIFKKTNEEWQKLISEREAALSSAAMSEAMEKQYCKVIEKLESRVQDLQQQLISQTNHHEQQMRDYAEQLNQLRQRLPEPHCSKEITQYHKEIGLEITPEQFQDESVEFFSHKSPIPIGLIVDELSVADLTEKKLDEEITLVPTHDQELPTSTQEENLPKYRELQEENERLRVLQKQTEQECLRLMDELLAIEKADNAIQQDSHDKSIVLDEKFYRREIEQLKLQISRDAENYKDKELQNQKTIEKLNQELSELESIIENRIFRETELEEAIELERKRVNMLEVRLYEEEEKYLNGRDQMNSSLLYSNYSQSYYRRQTPSSVSSVVSSSIASEISSLLKSVYCEICEEHGHDVLSCNALRIHEEDSFGYPSVCYCINCDVFEKHSTEECPNQDETF